MGIKVMILTKLAAVISRALENNQRSLARAAVKSGDPSICAITLKPHCYVTFHSAPSGQRLRCLDCDRASDVEASLTKPHNRSSMGTQK